MISAVDTNILLDIARPNPDFLENAIAMVERGLDEGKLVISTIVHAETAAHFPSQDLLDRFLEDLEISVEPLSTQSTWDADRAWLLYRERGGQRDRIMSDFLIGAHARNQAGRLLTRDRGFYRSYFDQLVVIEDPLGFED